MSGDFIDTNVLLYLFSDEDRAKQETAKNIFEMAVYSGQASISFQVVQEVLNGLLRRSTPAADVEDARRHLEEMLIPLWKVNPSEALYARALDTHSRYRYSFYDSLIIAAALEAGCSRLLSEDLQHGQRIEGLTITNPFIEASGSRR
jgi:predicted nucleic acid-binding protein